MQKIQEFCTEGWTEKQKLNTTVRAYWPDRASITVQRDLLMKDQRIIIPSSLRSDILDKIHAGHQEINGKCRERARESIWWPSLSKQIEDMVSTCPTCCKHLVASPNKMIGSESRKDSPAKEACDKDPQEPPNCTVRSGRMVISPT